MKNKLINLLFISGLIITGISKAKAADTVEPWNVGATDLDFYLDFNGVGLSKSERSMGGDIMLGYGLLNRLSAYAGIALEANGALESETPGLYLGLFGTVIETNHFDLDIFFNVAGGSSGIGGLTLTPAIELNFDMDPDMQSWGLYTRIGTPVYSREVSTNIPDETESEIVVNIESTIGTYYTIATGHQILVEYDMVLRPESFQDNHIQDNHKLESGGLAIGYNVLLTDSLEMINQVYLDFPQSDENFSVGFMIGLIATLL